jgi:SAM-dependent methyltransferase
MATSDREFVLPHPTDSGRNVAWTGDAFELDGKPARILVYEVSPSGWTDELTHLHEEIGGDDHFMDVASRAHTLSEVARCTDPAGSTILEIGVSSGFLLSKLAMQGTKHRVFGADYTLETLQTLGPKLPQMPLVRFDLTHCPLRDGTVDVVVLSNVLEHVGDHAAASMHLFRIVRPGGAVIVEVPAGPKLYDVYDRVLMHHRRYAMRQLTELMESAGFVIERRSHLGFFLYPAFYLAKRLNQLRYAKHDACNDQRLVEDMIAATRKRSAAMSALMRFEAALRPHVYFPFGIRCLLTCRRPAKA